VLSAFEIIKYLSNKKYRNDYTKIVLISSITSVIGRPGTLAYASSKGALVSAVKTLALELASKHININCISPGTIMTPMMEQFMSTLTENEREARLSGFPLGIGYATDISYTSVFLLSDAARWITGQNIIVDGGYTSK
jgi:NAD(P)-dependent dehydrogenase (short-subunit alcohol dehydrogenase family)